MIRPLLLAVAVIASACATAGTGRVSPRNFDFARIADSIVNSPPLHRAHIGIEVFDPATGKILYEHNGERRFVPASNEKLWGTTTALQVLGPDFRYRTPILGLGFDPMAGTTQSLVVVGRGDPTFSSRFPLPPPPPRRSPGSVDTSVVFSPQPDSEPPPLNERRQFAVLDSLADSVVARGIRRIAGDLIIDASYFDEAIVPGSWTYGNLNGTSAPPTGAFVVAEGVMQVRVSPGFTVGAPALVEIIGPTGVVPIANRVTTTPAGSPRRTSNTRGLWSDSLRFSGSIGIGSAPQRVQLPMSDPTRFAAHLFADALRSRGVVIDGSVRIVYDSAEAAGIREGRLSYEGGQLPVSPVTAWTSPPMSDIVRAILSPSQNWIAEQLTRTLGAEQRAQGSWRSGIAVETEFLFGTVGIDSAALRLQDGSGMSRENLVTPHAVVQLFNYARTAPWDSVFRAALAKPAEPGTLSSRLRQLEGRLAGKTGTLNSVNALSGYIRVADGRELIFSILSNASGGGPVVAAIDKMVEALANGRVPR